MLGQLGLADAVGSEARRGQLLVDPAFEDTGLVLSMVSRSVLDRSLIGGLYSFSGAGNYIGLATSLPDRVLPGAALRCGLHGLAQRRA